MQARTPANRASHGPRVKAKERVKRTREKSKGQSKGSKGAKGSCKGKTSKTGISGLENLKSETSLETQESVYMGQLCTTETSWFHDEWSPNEWNDGWSVDEMTTGVLFDGMRIANGCVVHL